MPILIFFIIETMIGIPSNKVSEPKPNKKIHALLIAIYVILGCTLCNFLNVNLLQIIERGYWARIDSITVFVIPLILFIIVFIIWAIIRAVKNYNANKKLSKK